MRTVLFCAVATVGTTLTASSCGRDDVAEVHRLVPEVLGSIPHDDTAFTQGLEMHSGMLLESTGRYGLSDRRYVSPVDGSIVSRLMLPTEHFGEGITVAGDKVFQLTWREGVAHVLDPLSLGETGVVLYEGEGWGICFDGTRLVMSDGSSTLTFRDPADFTVTGTVDVTLEGEPVRMLNELECAGERIWANVWQTTEIVGIDPRSGAVRDVVDASSLVPPGLGPDAVLNGIALDPTNGWFWVTGKLWPVMYRVRFG